MRIGSGIYKRKDGRYGLKNVAQLVVGKERRCASAKINGFQGFAVQIFGPGLHFTAQGLCVGRTLGKGDGGVEIAVDAAFLTERNVYI